MKRFKKSVTETSIKIQREICVLKLKTHKNKIFNILRRYTKFKKIKIKRDAKYISPKNNNKLKYVAFRNANFHTALLACAFSTHWKQPRNIGQL